MLSSTRRFIRKDPLRGQKPKCFFFKEDKCPVYQFCLSTFVIKKKICGTRDYCRSFYGICSILDYVQSTKIRSVIWRENYLTEYLKHKSKHTRSLCFYQIKASIYGSTRNVCNGFKIRSLQRKLQ